MKIDVDMGVKIIKEWAILRVLSSSNISKVYTNF